MKDRTEYYKIGQCSAIIENIECEIHKLIFYLNKGKFNIDHKLEDALKDLNQIDNKLKTKLFE